MKRFYKTGKLVDKATQASRSVNSTENTTTVAENVRQQPSAPFITIGYFISFGY